MKRTMKEGQAYIIHMRRRRKKRRKREGEEKKREGKKFVRRENEILKTLKMQMYIKFTQDKEKNDEGKEKKVRKV